MEVDGSGHPGDMSSTQTGSLCVHDQNHSDSLCPSTANDYGLFLSDEDPKKGIWLEAGKALDYYMLRNGVSHSGAHSTQSRPKA